MKTLICIIYTHVAQRCSQKISGWNTYFLDEQEQRSVFIMVLVTILVNQYDIRVYALIYGVWVLLWLCLKYCMPYVWLTKLRNIFFINLLLRTIQSVPGIFRCAISGLDEETCNVSLVHTRIIHFLTRYHSFIYISISPICNVSKTLILLRMSGELLIIYNFKF